MAHTNHQLPSSASTRDKLAELILSAGEAGVRIIVANGDTHEVREKRRLKWWQAALSATGLLVGLLVGLSTLVGKVHTVFGEPTIEAAAQKAIDKALNDDRLWAKVGKVASEAASQQLAVHERLEDERLDALVKAGIDREQRLREVERRR